MSDKKPETSLVLRVCLPDGTSQGGFQWPQEVGAEVIAPDWKNNQNCGNGLHGWLYGQGDLFCVSYWRNSKAKWMVLEVPSSEIVILDGECKFPRAKVRYIGTKSAAADFIIANEPKALSLAVIGACINVGDGEVAVTGGLGTATAGDNGTSTTGHRGISTARYNGTATAGYDGTAMAENYGTATAGMGGTATAGVGGMATAGDNGTATAGVGGKAMAGINGEIRIRYWDQKGGRFRTKIGYVGERGIKANTLYRLNENNKFEEVQQ